MSFSDFVLAILVLVVTALILWVYDMHPYTNKLHVYTQQCDNMILDNTYCKGTWQDKPVEAYIVNRESKQIVHITANQPDIHTFENCNIKDRKNWTCNDTRSNKDLAVKNGKLLIDAKGDIQQITRLQWLQNKVLKSIN